MTITYHLSGYSVIDDRRQHEINVPLSAVGYVADVAGVDTSEDPQALNGSYQIPDDRLIQLNELLRGIPDVHLCEWFLEAMETSDA